MVELIAVIAVTLVISAGAIPVVRSFGTNREKAAATTLAGDLELAREHARLGGLTTFIVVNRSSYRVLREVTPGGGLNSALPLVAKSSNRIVGADFTDPTGAGVSINVAPGGIRFGFDASARLVSALAVPMNRAVRVRFSGGSEVRVEPGGGRVIADLAPQRP